MRVVVVVGHRNIGVLLTDDGNTLCEVWEEVRSRTCRDDDVVTSIEVELERTIFIGGDASYDSPALGNVEGTAAKRLKLILLSIRIVHLGLGDTSNA